MNIFVTSTEEQSGKTIFCAGVAAVMQSLNYEMGVFKPVQTGCKYANDKQFSPDLNFVKKIDPNIKTYSSYNLKQKTVPAVAFENEHIKFTMESVLRDYNTIKQENDLVLIEGVGGFLTPITSRISNGDIAVKLKTPLIFIVDVKEGFINKTLAALNTIQTQKIDVVGIVFNNYSPTEKNNAFHQEVKLLEQMTDYKVLGCIPNVNYTGEGITPENLISEVLQNIELSEVFEMEIPKLDF